MILGQTTCWEPINVLSALTIPGNSYKIRFKFLLKARICFSVGHENEIRDVFLGAAMV
jgi:hypothetical protein